MRSRFSRYVQSLSVKVFTELRWSSASLERKRGLMDAEIGPYSMSILLVTSPGIRMVAVSPIGPGMTSLNPGSRRIKGIVSRVD